MPGYVVIDKNKTALLDDIVVVMAKGGRAGKSRIISRKGNYYSSTTPKKIAERVRSDDGAARPLFR